MNVHRHPACTLAEKNEKRSEVLVEAMKTLVEISLETALGFSVKSEKDNERINKLSSVAGKLCNLDKVEEDES